jgi:glycosyltransferase involved in cell wall biosynthesis
MSQNLDLSIIMACYNEEESLASLHDKITDTLDPLGHSFEIIFVDDGSNDQSNQIIRSLQKKDPRIRLITFKVNSGKSNALNQGFLAAKGDIVFTMDADLQDDPKEIPSFLEKIDEGYDLVSGWKKQRYDPLEKKLPSKIFNKIVSLVAGIKLHDFNCGFKAYRREVVEELNIYGELHRFIPALVYWKGFRVCEIPVQHHPRQFGKSKYGWKRYYQGFFDLFTMLLLTRFIQRPVYLFGLPGLVTGFAGVGILIFITFLQLIYGSIMGHKPLSYLGVLSILLGSQMVASGLIAEMLVKLKSENKKKYSIREVFPFNNKQRTSFDLSIILTIDHCIDLLMQFLETFTRELPGCNKTIEVILIVNGRCDLPVEHIKRFYFLDNCTVRLVFLRKFLKYSDAIQVGYSIVSGQDVIIMPVEMKNIFENIRRMTFELNENIQIIKGRRHGMPLWESMLSMLNNRFVSLLTGVKLFDHHCGLYALKKEIIPKIKPYGEPAVFFPLIASKLEGISWVEVDVPYDDFRPIKLKTKLKLFFIDILEVLANKLAIDFNSRPLHLFGLIGVFIGMIGFLINLYLCMLKLFTGSMDEHYTLLLMGITLVIIGVQWFAAGLLGEIINSLNQSGKNKENGKVVIKVRGRGL